MPIPDFQTIMRPLLVAVSDGQDHSIRVVRARLAEEFTLTAAELEEQIPSGRATTFGNRVGWATTHLYRCGLLERPKRSVYRISDRGRTVLDPATAERVLDLGVVASWDGREEIPDAGSEEPLRRP